MREFLQLVATIVEAASLILAIVFLVSLFFRKKKQTLRNSIYPGALFSFAVFVAMSNPLDLGQYGIYDLRSLLIGAATAILGPLAGLMTVVVALIMRVFLGGAGMWPGIVSILATFAGALIWRYFIRDRLDELSWQSVSLGLMITLHVIGILAFPQDLWGELFVSITPAYLVVNTLGSHLILLLMRGELTFLSDAEASYRHANIDHLTGLLNRRGFEHFYPGQGTGVDANRGRALLYFDIDHFKGFNDRHGHKAGDDVLRYVTERIKANLRPNDIFARLGGDEFTVVLDQIDAKEAEHIAERCRKVVAEGNISNDDTELSVSISVGAIWMLGHTEIDNILDQADKALYSAKKQGRNTVVFRHAKDIIWPMHAVPAGF